MAQTFSGDGRTVGSVMVIQALLAQILARHPEREIILATIKNYSDGIEADADTAAASGNAEEFMFFSDIVGGMQDTSNLIRETVDAVVAEKLV